MHDRVTRMVAEAQARLADADILGQSLSCHSDSQSLIRILALEVLLKAVQLKYTGKITRSHNYLDIWKAIPGSVQQIILGEANNRYPYHANLSDHEALLTNFEWIFMKARYGYELYEDISLIEQTQIGQKWLAEGGALEDADIRYHPLELEALLHALAKVARSAA